VGAKVTQPISQVGQVIADPNTRTGQTGPGLEALATQLLRMEKLGPGFAVEVFSITRLFGDWSVKTKEQTGTLDQLFRLSQKSGIEIEGLSSLMVEFGSPLRQLGLDFESTAAMFARFEKEGVNKAKFLNDNPV
jgi:phage-related minor tail protein